MMTEIQSAIAGFGPAVLNHLWQTTLFAGAVWLVTLLLRKNAARVRFSLWLAASIKFLVPFSLLIGLGGLLPRPQRMVADAPTTVYSAMDAVGQPFAEFNSGAAKASAHSMSGLEMLKAELPVLLAVVWFCGAVVVLVVWCVRWLQVRRMLHRATLAQTGREFEILQRLNGGGEIPLILSRDLMEPGIFGVFRPVLIWPEQLSAQLDDEHIEAILAHESCHARRRDNLTAALHMLDESLFWFHPMVWWIERRMIDERERACDEAVVSLGSAPGAYAEGLLKACRFCLESPLACVSGIIGADLAGRVRAIMSNHSQKLSPTLKTIIAVFALTTIAAPIALGVVRMIPLCGQIVHATGPLPAFEVSTIKPTDTAEPRTEPPPISENMVGLFNTRLRSYIGDAYGLPWRAEKVRVIGGPSWIDDKQYDIVGKIPDDLMQTMKKMSPEERHTQTELMEQSLLISRFNLKVHFETRELPVYELVVDKGGVKLTPAKVPGPVPVPLPPPLNLQQGMEIFHKNNGMELAVRYMTLHSIFEGPFMYGATGREVVNKTGLDGKYDFTLDWTPDRPGAPSAADAGTVDNGPSIFTAIQEQLGLKLVPAKAPFEVIIIDSIELPTPN